MSRPSAPLIDLAADRPVPPVLPIGPALVESAREHNMQGLLHSSVLVGAGVAGPEEREALATDSLRIRDHARRLWEAWSTVQAAAVGTGVEIAAIKGPSAERRWYDREGERPCIDLDVWLAPTHRHRLPELVEVLHPDHVLSAADLAQLVDVPQFQSIELTVGDVSVDLHVDVLKLGIPSRIDDVLWERTVAIEGPDGAAVTVLDPVGALLHHLLHLNKDRFRRLLGLADVARILQRERPDLAELADLAGIGGLEVPVACSLHTVVDELALDVDLEAVLVPRGWRAATWKGLWSRRVRLAGDLGFASYRYRQELLPFLVTGAGRPSQAVGRLVGDALPPQALVRYHNPEIGGGYVRQLTVGRIRRWRRRRSAVAEAKRSAA